MRKFYYVILVAALPAFMSCGGTNSEKAGKETVDTVVVEAGDNVSAELSTADMERIKGLADKVNPDIKEKFETLHAAWYEAASSTPEIAVSSYSGDIMKLPQFAQLVEMGSEILPLVVEKMIRDDSSATVHVYEAIQTDEKLKDPSESVLQDRAKRSAKLWLGSR